MNRVDEIVLILVFHEPQIDGDAGLFLERARPLEDIGRLVACLGHVEHVQLFGSEGRGEEDQDSESEGTRLHGGMS